MKSNTLIVLTAIVILFASCKKENMTIQSTGTADESSTQAHLTEMNEPAANAVQIGTQVWRTKNLDVTRYRNGDPIPYVKSKAKWATLTTGAWCWYRNDSTKGAVYGKLYNWAAVNDPRGLAPEGWHVPSDEEWDILSTFLGGADIAGGKMKETGTIHWEAPNTYATNSSGFTALPGGYCTNDGTFSNLGTSGNWWSSTEFNNYSAWYRDMSNVGGYIARPLVSKRTGFSVRCVKD